MSYKFLGALGFGLGGIIVALAGDYMIFAYLLMGALGSAFLTIPARNLKLTILSSLIGGLSFFIGFSIPMFFFMVIVEPPFKYFFLGLIMGLFAGAMLGFAFRNIKVFALWGMVGFGLSYGISFMLLEVLRPIFPDFFQVIVLLLAGAIGGAFLGHAASIANDNKKVKKA